MSNTIFTTSWLQYRLTSFNYDCSSDNQEEHSIEIGFQLNNDVRKLCFEAPVRLKVEEGFPNITSRLEIIDVSSYQLENITVQVSDFELSEGGLCFYAKRVYEIEG